jgi:glycosyltransferase involved in cell wall biosynthesis
VKIFGLINRNSGPGFHRVMMPLLLMKETDAYITNAVEESDFEKRRPDLIYYNRLISDDVLRLQSKYHFRIAVDVDDWWELDTHHILYKHSRDNNFPAHQIKHLRMADVVTCTHERLAEKVYEFNKNVVVCPNAIPEHDYFPVQRTVSANGHKRIFWQGSVTHEADVNLLRSTVKKLDKEKFMMVMAGYTEQIEWERMGDCFTNYKKMPGVVLPGTVPWEYYKNYQYADICVVPLLSTRFNVMKSNLKILEAAHSGLPCIASNVHPYKNMEGVMYADKKQDWYNWLMAQNEWPGRAEALSAYCKKFFNFEEINQKRRAAIVG